MRLFDWLQELLFPRKCVLCGSVLSRDETDLCRACRAQTPAHSHWRQIPGIDGVCVVWNYAGPVRDSLLRFKFQGRRDYGPGYGRLLAMALLPEREQADCVTWVPVSPQRKRTRGYDQAELLARAVGKELNLPVVSTLEKVRHNPAQSGLSAPEARRKNVVGVYQGCRETICRHPRIILIDDILTTGATAGECAKVLRAMGAKRVVLGAMAGSGYQEPTTILPEQPE